MTHIKITKGIDIPIKGKPEGKVKPLIPGGEVSPLITPPQISLNLKSFEDVKFKLLIKAGDVVKIGQPLVEDKSRPGCVLVSPAAGTIKEIRRGLKRVLHDIVIDVAKQEETVDLTPIDIKTANREEIVDRLKEGGGFFRIRSRPFNFLANPQKIPRNVFVKALESAPFVPPSELQVAGHEKEFQAGLTALAKLTNGIVHLVYHKESPCRAFTEAQNVQKHTAEGPHPISNSSLHIQEIDPVRGSDDNVWTLKVHDVIVIGDLLLNGHHFIDRVISIAGPAILPDKIGYFKAREGYPIGALIAGRIEKGVIRFISGDPLMGHRVNVEDFLGFDHFVFCAIRENFERQFLHFFRLGLHKYTFSKAYLSGHLDNREREYDFTTSLHGEHRAFIDDSLYQKVQPLNIPTMLLVKAVMAEDYDLAETLGLLGVDSEDFALPTFVCPSKMEMTEIIKNGLKFYSKEVLA